MVLKWSYLKCTTIFNVTDVTTKGCNLKSESTMANLLILQSEYRKVANSSLSRLVARFQIFRRLMKGKFDAYVLWPLAKKFQNWIVDRSTARDFTVCWFLCKNLSNFVPPAWKLHNPYCHNRHVSIFYHLFTDFRK